MRYLPAKLFAPRFVTLRQHPLLNPTQYFAVIALALAEDLGMVYVVPSGTNMLCLKYHRSDGYCGRVQL